MPEGCCGWRTCGCCGCRGVLTVGSSGAGWTQLRMWGGQRAPGTHSVAASLRDEGADLGEGLAAADKQEAAAHEATLSADQSMSQPHGHVGACTGRNPWSSCSHSGGHSQIHSG